MNKKIIETFITKYHLGGLVEKIRWSNDNNTLKATAMTADKKLLVNVELNNFDTFKGYSFPVGNTSKLKNVLAPMPEELCLDLQKDEKNDTRVTGLVFSNKDVDFKFPTLDESQIDGDPKLKNVPPFETEVTLTPEFLDMFIRQINACGYDSFSFAMSKKRNRLEAVLGHSDTQNLIRVAMAVPAVAGKDKVKAPISFSAKCLKAILASNSECESPVLKVSDAGLASIEFDKDGFKSQYYLIKVEVED